MVLVLNQASEGLVLPKALLVSNVGKQRGHHTDTVVHHLLAVQEVLCMTLLE